MKISVIISFLLAMTVLFYGSGCVSTQQHLMMQAMMTYEYRQLETAYNSLECELIQSQAENAQLRQVSATVKGNPTSEEVYRPPMLLDSGERDRRVPSTLGPTQAPEWSPDF